jgi:ubiquinone/menaquinone biosynthesis C-methylase UbiE
MRGVEQIPWLYDLGLSVSERLGFIRWRRWLAEGATGRTLDLGTGTGRNLSWFAAAGPVVAVDPSRHNLRAARARRPEAMLVRARAESLPFRDGAFDTVVSGLVFCSVDDPAAGFAEVQRVLGRDGSLRMIEHVRSGSALEAWWQDLIQPAWTWVAGGCRNNRETERAVVAAGFEIDLTTHRASGTMRRFVARVAFSAARVDRTVGGGR